MEADAVGAGMLDVSSGVEESPGIKSAPKLEALFAALRSPVAHPSSPSGRTRQADTRLESRRRIGDGWTS
jgi:hypothetical protein